MRESSIFVSLSIVCTDTASIFTSCAIVLSFIAVMLRLSAVPSSGVQESYTQFSDIFAELQYSNVSVDMVQGCVSIPCFKNVNSRKELAERMVPYRYTELETNPKEKRRLEGNRKTRLFYLESAT